MTKKKAVDPQKAVAKTLKSKQLQAQKVICKKSNGKRREYWFRQLDGAFKLQNPERIDQIIAEVAAEAPSSRR